MRATSRFFLRSIVWILMLGLVSSCAYKLRRGSLSRGVGEIEGSRVFVPIVDNMTSETGPESALTGALREAMSTLDGLEVVNSSGEARFILEGRVTDWGRRLATPTPLANAADEARGGLIRNQTSAADIKVYLETDFELLEVIPGATGAVALRRSLWKRQFRAERKYEAYDRFDELAGSSSAPHINRSRERLALREMSETISRQIIDQVSQDF